jgi:DNA repair protein RecO (recombination protein O)
MMACEWINLSEVGEEANIKMFNLLYETLNGLDKATMGLKNILRCFQLHSLELHGFKPELMSCTTCNKQEIPELVTFDLNEGTYQCNRCHRVDGLALTGASLSFLRWLDQVKPSNACNVSVKPEVGNEIDELLVRFGKAHIESFKNLKVSNVISAITEKLQN